MTTILQLSQEDLRAEIKSCLRESIEEIKSIPATVPLPDRINKEGVKQMTGKGDQWIYSKTMKVCKDPLPFEKFGKTLVFSRKKIQKYIDDHTKPLPTAGDIMEDRLSRSAKKHLKK